MGDKFNKEYWLTPVGLSLIQGWARDGLTDEQIAERMGIVRQTLWVWRGKHAELEKAIRVGKEVADYLVEAALYKNAIEGNVTAQIFWLKNRRPDKWNSSPSATENSVNAEMQEQRLEELRKLLAMSVPSSKLTNLHPKSAE